MWATLERQFYDLYLEHFHKAEANRRWNLREDIPWDQGIPGWDAQDHLIRRLGIFDDRIYMRDVVRPVLKALGVRPDELREARRRLDAA